MLVGLGVPIHDDFDQKNGIGRWVCSWNQVFLGSILNFILCPTIVVTSLKSGQWGWTGWQNTAGSMASPDTSPSPFFRGRAVWAPCACLNRPSKHLIKSLCSIQWRWLPKDLDDLTFPYMESELHIFPKKIHIFPYFSIQWSPMISHKATKNTWTPWSPLRFCSWNPNFCWNFSGSTEIPSRFSSGWTVPICKLSCKHV